MRKNFQLWKVEYRISSTDCREFKFLATACEHGDSFFLECSWEQCLYCLTVYKNGTSTDEIIFTRCMFADADADKYVDQIMRIARQDIERKLARLDELHNDGVIGVVSQTSRRLD